MTQLRLPLNTRGPWLMFNKGTDHEAARARFTEKFGFEAERVEHWPCWLWIGPAPKKEIERL